MSCDRFGGQWKKHIWDSKPVAWIGEGKRDFTWSSSILISLLRKLVYEWGNEWEDDIGSRGILHASQALGRLSSRKDIFSIGFWGINIPQPERLLLEAILAYDYVVH